MDAQQPKRYYHKLLKNESKVLKWLMLSATKDDDTRPMLDSIHCGEGYFATTNGFVLHAAESNQLPFVQDDLSELPQDDLAKSTLLDVDGLKEGVCIVEAEYKRDPKQYPKLPIANTDKTVLVHVNKKYLIDALSAMQGTVTIAVHGSKYPIELFGYLEKGNTGRLYAAVMPMKVIKDDDSIESRRLAVKPLAIKSTEKKES